MANGESQRTVLLATQEAVEHYPGLPTPDFNMGSGTDRMDPAGGAVCFTGTGVADCVTWGSIPLFDLFSGFPEPQASNAVPIGDEGALRRKITGGCATWLDAADDTADAVRTSLSPRPLPATMPLLAPRRAVRLILGLTPLCSTRPTRPRPLSPMPRFPMSLA